MGCAPVRSKGNIISNESDILNIGEGAEQKHRLQFSQDKYKKLIRIYSYKVKTGENTSITQRGESTATDFNFEKILKQDISKEKEKKKKTSTITVSQFENSNITPIQEVSESKSLNSTIKDKEKDYVVSLNQEVNSQPITVNDIKFFNTALRNHFLFTELSNAVLDKIFGELFIFRISAGDILYKEGDCGYFFFIVKHGKLQMTSETEKGTTVQILKEGDTFGEVALLQMTTRTENIKTLEPTEVYLLDGKIFRETVYTINKFDYKERVHFLRLIPMFKWIDQIELRNLSDSLIKCEYNAERIIEREGFTGDSIFIVIEGRIKCMRKDVKVGEINSQEYIGEALIIFNSNWPFDLVAETKVKCYQLLKRDTIKSLGETYANTLLTGICKEAFNSTKMLQYLMMNVNNIFTKILTLFQHFVYDKDAIICEKSSYNLKPKIIIVIEGSLVPQGNKLSHVANRGELFGEEYIMGNNTQLSSNIISLDNSSTYEAYWEDISKCLNESIINDSKETNEINSNILMFYERIFHMKRIEMFKNISDKDLLEISQLMKQKTYHKGEEIIKENTEGKNIYFLNKGTVHIFHQGKKLREYQDYVCFGEISLLQNQPHTATVIAMEDTSVYLLSKEDFQTILNHNMSDYLVKKISLMDNNSLQLNDLYFIKTLGEGKFGNVSLVHDKKNVYAIKAVSQQFATKKRMLTKYFIKERDVLLTVEHPFIIKLVKTFHDDSFIFYLMEFINGIDLSRHLAKRSENSMRKKLETQFYIASVFLVVKYLHQKKIAHRDIKAENIMLDELGYVKIIDFNTCGVIKDLTNTIVGTPHYMAPELLVGKGYGFSIDYWSIGVLAYKIYFGFFPFGNQMSNPMNVYHDIIQKELLIPFNVDEEFKLFITKLLDKKPIDRLCNFEQVKHSKFFLDFNWEELLDMKMSTPYVPQTTIDTSDLLLNMDETYIQMLLRCPKSNITISTMKNDPNQTFNSHWAEEF